MKRRGQILFLIFLALFTAVTLFAEEGGAGEALQGVAAIIGAATPAVVTAVQAGAAKDIAKTQAASAKELATISSQTTLQLSKDNMETALMQTKTVENVNTNNNQSATLQTAMQLSTTEKLANLKYARDERESYRGWLYKMETLRLQEQAMNDTFKMQMRQLDLKLVADGNATPFSTPHYSSEVRTNRILAAATRPNQSRIGPVVGQSIYNAYYRGVIRGSTRSSIRRGTDLSAFQASVGTRPTEELIPHAPLTRGLASEDSSSVLGKVHR